MQLRTRICILMAILLLVNSSFTVLLSETTVSATPSGKTRFYFRNYLDTEGAYDMDYSGMFMPVSETPPTETNNSYYPPNFVDLISDSAAKQEEFATWLSYLLLSYLDELSGDELPSDWIDMFGGIDIILPNPLRIVESYDYMGDERLSINGDIEFDLDFTSNIASRLDQNDNVKVSVYTMTLLPELVNETTVAIPQSTSAKISTKKIIVENVNITVDPSTSIIFAIEIIPSNTTFISSLFKDRPVLESLAEKSLDSVLNIMSKSTNSQIKNTAMLIDDFRNITSEANFTKSDLADISNAFFGPSLVYDSVDHKSSVTVPFSSTANAGNQITYYLSQDNNLATEFPSGDYISDSLGEGTRSFSSPSFARSKMLTSASAEIYISYKDMIPVIDPMSVNVVLMKDSTEIATEVITFEKTYFSTDLSSYFITFDDITTPIEISHNSDISLSIELVNASNMGMFRAVNLLYDSIDYASSLSVSLAETDHIEITQTVSPNDAKIIPGDSVVYSLLISSEKSDSLTIREKSSENKEGFWNIAIQPETLEMDAEDEKTVLVYMNSTQYALESYEQDPVVSTIEVFGNTGYTITVLSAEVSDDAVTYSTIVEVPESKEITQGENHTYQFIIKNNNSGLWPDSYIFTATSEQGFNVEVSPRYIDDVAFLNTTKVNVTVFVPEDIESTSDVLTFKVISKDENGLEISEMINYSIVRPGFSADFFGFFESLAQDLGLEESFGDFAPFVIPILLIIVMFIVMILIVFIVTNKKIKVSCLIQKKEIYPNESAVYHVVIKNTSSQKQIISIDVSLKEFFDKWNVDCSQSSLSLLPKESQTIDIRVIPSDNIAPDDSAAVEVIVETSLVKSKPVVLHLEAVVKNGVSDISIEEVSHWPCAVVPNEKVTTSFKVHNRGSIQTKHIKIKMFINGKEKNKVEDIIIPARGYAEIQLPWIAEKGKNQLSLIVT